MSRGSTEADCQDDLDQLAVNEAVKFFHCSIRPVETGTLLVGLKSAHKNRQRVGQRLADEIFEQVRKERFPDAPSLFTSLWVSSGRDSSIARKMFEETPDAAEAFLYEVAPVEPPYRVESFWEISACRSVTQSGLRGGALRGEIERAAIGFWTPQIRDEHHPIYLCGSGAVAGELAHVFRREEIR